MTERGLDVLKRFFTEIITNLLVGFIGRPILYFIKSFRWVFLFFGIFFNRFSIYNPNDGITESQFTIILFLIGFILFCMGLAIKRYDIMIKEYFNLFETYKELLKEYRELIDKIE